MRPASTSTFQSAPQPLLAGPLEQSHDSLCRVTVVQTAALAHGALLGMCPPLHVGHLFSAGIVLLPLSTLHPRLTHRVELFAS